MKNRFKGLLLGVVIGIGATLSFGFLNSPQFVTRDLTVSVSGLPNDRTIDVWSGDIPANATHGSEKLATFESGQPAHVRIPSNRSMVQLTVRPFQQTVNNEKVGHQVTEDSAPGVRYITEKPEYNLSQLANLNVVFKKQYRLSLGTSATVRGTNMGAADSARALVHFNPPNSDGWYDEGVPVTVTVSKGQGVQFAYWIINDPSSGGVNTDIREFSSADNPLKIILSHPTDLMARFVGEWQQLPDQTDSDGIVVQNLVEGQQIEIIQNGISAVEKTVGKGETEVKLPVEPGKQLGGHIIITAPDGITEIFQSPTYDNLQAGNKFFY